MLLGFPKEGTASKSLCCRTQGKRMRLWTPSWCSLTQMDTGGLTSLPHLGYCSQLSTRCTSGELKNMSFLCRSSRLVKVKGSDRRPLDGLTFGSVPSQP